MPHAGGIRLLVVDDSALMRKHMRQIFEAEGDFTLAFARNGREALEQAEAFAPDVVTLDVNMPELDGISCLERLSRGGSPARVVMVSSLTEAGAAVTLQALDLGAVDFIAKPDGTVSLSIDRIRMELVGKVRAAARARPRRARGLRERIGAQRRAVEHGATNVAGHRVATRAGVAGLVLIGVSTGGPRTLEEILPALPADYPWPVLVAQHMPSSFTGVFARRMDSLCALDVTEVDRPVPLEPGRVYIGRGDSDIVVEKRLGRLVANSVPADASLWHPSADRLVSSAMAAMPAALLTGVLLTGMGNDGAEAMAALRKSGGRTIAESEESAVVFGMPAELIKRGGADIVLPAEDVARQLLAWSRRGR
ncbi:chemotaxis-specific protein-glutamate methyltransferase CheB [Roseomonas sp. PWR1]|uniref:Protein-glutamate methylesterase/protein-glutamine glutaminase n=1 Tax=Roseomonas nitratireducens TaxID=2820810 RepID=A0ABS4ARD6_9PROT|nr:chemotaxis-specific protein-glutamate methyltransferase CheB [Neoroseomonas nitratireducens]MBP0463929.1 chemotaxis-specific protein-glutamate methyltransferase CheB [Neoroseomonas nitratireducens]